MVDNVFERRYDTYGPVGEVPWPNIAGGVTEPRTASPGSPLSVSAGVRVRI